MSAQSAGDRAPRDRSDRRGRDAVVADLTALLGPQVESAGLDLEEVDVRPAGRRRLVRVVVDADGGVGLDAITRLSRALAEVLDGSDPLGTAPYVLEVTSPGVERPLTEQRHWRRAVGRLVVAALTDGGQVEGRIVAVDETSVVLDVTVKGGKAAKKGGIPAVRRRRLDHGELGRGRVQVEFRRPDEPAETDAPTKPVRKPRRRPTGESTGEQDTVPETAPDPASDPAPDTQGEPRGH